MEIDDETEEKVRATLHWAVKRQEDEFDEALGAYSALSERTGALTLLIAVSRYVVLDICAGVPSPNQVTALAAEVTAAEDWSGIALDEVDAFLALAARGEPGEQLSPEAFVVVAFVTTASLLAMRPKPAGQWWFDYLDQVEAALEAAA